MSVAVAPHWGFTPAIAVSGLLITGAALGSLLTLTLTRGGCVTWQSGESRTLRCVESCRGSAVSCGPSSLSAPRMEPSSTRAVTGLLST